MKPLRHILIVLTLMLISRPIAQASPETVLFDVTGLFVDDNNPDSRIAVLPEQGLVPQGRYKLLITGRDIDDDVDDQIITGIWFDLVITNGTLAAFTWLVPGDLVDSDLTNDAPGDHPGQVAIAAFTGFAIPTQVLINLNLKTPRDIAMVYFIAGNSGTPLSINFDSNPYVSGTDSENSHYVGPDGTLYNINQGDGLVFERAVGTPLLITSFAFRPTLFSPNGDRANDATVIYGSFNHSANWNILIQNASGAKVKNFSGTGSGMKQTWDGKNQSGSISPDGSYTVTLRGTDAGNSTAAQSGQVSIDTVSPVVSNLNDSPGTFSPSAGQSTTISFTLSEAAYTTLRIYNSSGTLIATLLNNVLKSSGANAVTWNGRTRSAPVPAGVYTYTLLVTDGAGNRAQPYPAQGTVTVN